MINNEIASVDAAGDDMDVPVVDVDVDAPVDVPVDYTKHTEYADALC
jgi:hypothetical protein